MEYLSWQEKNIGDAAAETISKMYADGFLFTRIGKGIMKQTRSVRIDLAQFELSSENRRILKRTSTISLHDRNLPLTSAEYDWSLAKCAKDFYEIKFGAGTMSANKVKEMLTDGTKSNFNTFLTFLNQDEKENLRKKLGFVICYKNSQLLHYCYPFYDLSLAPKDMGLGMMVQAIVYAQKLGLRYVYLGSLQRPNDTYKLQFKGLEWFDGKNWQDDVEEIKNILEK